MATEILRPSGAGSLTQIYGQYPTSGAHWDKVDDVIADDAKTYVSAHDGPATDLYALTAPTGSGIINSVTIYFRTDIGWSTPPPNWAKGKIKTHGTIYSTEADTGNHPYVTFSSTWITNPYTGKPWTWDEIDALEAGVELFEDGGSAYCTQVYVEVNYGPLIPPEEPTVPEVPPGFAPGVTKTAKVLIPPVTPAGLSCTAELYLVSTAKFAYVSGIKRGALNAYDCYMVDVQNIGGAAGVCTLEFWSKLGLRGGAGPPYADWVLETTISHTLQPAEIKTFGDNYECQIPYYSYDYPYDGKTIYRVYAKFIGEPGAIQMYYRSGER